MRCFARERWPDSSNLGPSEPTHWICRSGDSLATVLFATELMPEVVLELRWPDGEASSFYSPSTVVYEFLKPGDRLSIAELEQKGLAALSEASERVRARYGFACTRTDEEALKLRKRVAKYNSTETVEVEGSSN
jgi:uncharacterized repeat protein (TIGR04042 family)